MNGVVRFYGSTVVDFQGQRRRVSELAKSASRSVSTVVSRLNRGMSLDDALASPPDQAAQDAQRRSVLKRRGIEPPSERTVARVDAQRDIADRLIDWLRDPSRKPAHLAFTAGPERELADEIEGAMRREREPDVR